MCQKWLILFEFMQWVVRLQPAIVEYSGNCRQEIFSVLVGKYRKKKEKWEEKSLDNILITKPILLSRVKYENYFVCLKMMGNAIMGAY